MPPRLSSGYLVRDAHRAFQRLLERRIAPYGVTRGQWYFLRVLWITDGLSQRELSARVGMMEPTTVIALRSMERAGLIRRVRGADDRRKVRVFLTAKAKRLRDELADMWRAASPRKRKQGIAAARPRRRSGGHHRADDGKSRPDRTLAAKLAIPAADAMIAAKRGAEPRDSLPHSGVCLMKRLMPAPHRLKRRWRASRARWRRAVIEKA